MARYEPGIYDCVIESQGLAEVDNEKRTPFFFLVFTPVGGQYQCRLDLWITEPNRENFYRDLETLGFSGRSIMDLDPDNPNHHNFVGETVQLECRNEPARDDSGKVYDRWQLPYKPKALAPAKAEKNLARKLDAIFGASMKAKFGGKKKPAAKAQNTPLTPADVLPEMAPPEGPESVPF